MFEAKKKTLFTANDSKSTSKSTFVQAGLKISAEILTGNGAKAYNSTGDPFVDQFGSTSKYKEIRPFSEIAKDCEILWTINKEDAVKFIFFLRMICRKINDKDHGTKEAQKGSELRHEGIMRLIWLHTKDKEVFWKNAWLIPLVGSWKDLFVMLRYDLIYNGWENRVLDWERFGDLILSGLNSDSQTNLVRKYLPQIKARSKRTTVEAQANCMIAKWLCSELYGASGAKTDAEKYQVYRSYARMKASGTAHSWQQLISKQKYAEIDFDKIHGRALNILVHSKFLENHNLKEKYQEWVGSPEVKEVKYTGFVHELFQPICNKALHNIEKHIQDTINKQFMTLVNKCQNEGNTTDLIVVRDTSGSMSSDATGVSMSCYNISKAIALYFSYFLKGRFQNAWIEFNSNAQLHEWRGNTPLEKWYNDHSGYYGSTNFESVIALFVRLKSQGIPEEEFPKGILCISDCEFNPSCLNKTSVERVHSTLRRGGFSEEYINNFVVCLWNLRNHYYQLDRTPFQTYGDVKNVYYMSGYSAQIVSFLNGKVQTTRDLFDEAMNQEILSFIKM